LGENISNKEICTSLKVSPVFCYDLIDLDKTNYHFQQSCFENTDIKAYFTQIKKISSSTLDTLIGDKDLHLRKSKIEGNLKTVLSTLHGYDNLRIYPDINHFALYMPKSKKADRKTGDKAPRIYFLVGQNSMLYILFYFIPIMKLIQCDLV
jgi:hypothetical protein